MLNFKKNQKKFMAFFSVGLMIAFALPTAFSNYQKQREVPVGHAGSYTVTNKDIDQARQEWEAMRRIVIRVPDPVNRSQVRDVSCAQYLLEQMQVNPAVMEQFRDDEAAYFLLQREADQMGITVGQDEIAFVMANRVPQADDQLSDAELVEVIRGFWKVLDAATLAKHSIHASTPEIRDALSRAQPFSAKVVEFKASDYLSKVPPYTQAERTTKLVEQYEKYKNDLPTTRPTTPVGDPQNEFAFGYRVPNEVQVQYFGVQFDAAKAFVKAKIDEVDAIRFYKENPERFPATQPFRTVTFNGVAPGPYVAAPKQPTTRPVPSYYKEFSAEAPALLNAPPKTYKDYKKDVYEALTEKRAGELTTNILNDATTTMSADLADFKKSPAGQAYAATAPSTAPAASYPTYEYMQKLALHEQEKFGLLATVGDTGALKDEKQLEDLKGIGKLFVRDGFSKLSDLAQRVPPQQQMQLLNSLKFPWYATNVVEGLITPDSASRARLLGLRQIAVLEPSPIFQPLMSNEGSYFFRAVRAVPTHAALQGEVAQRLLDDSMMKDAYALARKDAEAFAAEARKSRLESAAAKAGKKVMTTGVLQRGDLGQVPITDNATKGVFANAAETLLQPTAQSNDPLHPIGVFDLKPTDTAYVGELDGLDPRWSANNLATYERIAAQELNGADGARFFRTWFNLDDIYRRMRYTPTNPPKKKPNRGPEPQEPEIPLDNRFG